MPVLPRDHVPMGYTLLSAERVAEIIGRTPEPGERLAYDDLRLIWDAYGTRNVQQIPGKGVAVNESGADYNAVSEASFIGDTTGLNTRIEIMYRDASNYKERFDYVAEGALTLEQAKALIDSLDVNGNFLPGLVGLGAASWSSDGDDAAYEDDHPFHEIDGIELTSRPADLEETAAELVAKFVAVGPQGWVPPKKKRRRRAG